MANKVVITLSIEEMKLLEKVCLKFDEKPGSMAKILVVQKLMELT